MVEMQANLEEMINKQESSVYLLPFLCMYTRHFSSSTNTVMTICSATASQNTASQLLYSACGMQSST